MDKYVIEAEIGAGNYGAVVLVRHRESGTRLVCKMIDWSKKTPKQQKDSENEVRIMSRLRHPNIISFMEAFVEKKTLHILMEYADHCDLERELMSHAKRQVCLSEERIMELFVQIALGLRYIHKQHLLHRDLKSANVFLTSSGAVKMGDFGFAKELNYTMALANTVCGTPYYFAPEICQRQPYNVKADIWSLGVILYEMINLRKPYDGRNLPELRKRIIEENFTPHVATHVSKDVLDLCGILLRKQVSQRPTVEQLLQIPVVRQHLEKFSKSIHAKQIQAMERGRGICQKHGRKQDEPAAPTDGRARRQSEGAASPQGPSFAKLTMDRDELKRMGSNPEQRVGPVSAQPDDTLQELYQRELPDTRAKLSKHCPPTVVAELTTALLEEENTRALETDVRDVLTSPVVAGEQSSPPRNPPEGAELGSAECEEEAYLQSELREKDQFVNCINVAVQLTDKAPDSEEAVALTRKLQALLGPTKTHLLPMVVRVASLFELDD